MPETQRPQILFVQSNPLEPGGRTAVFAWMLQALRDDYALTVFTWKPFNVSRLNSLYGTTLQTSDVRFVRPGRAMRWLAGLVEVLDCDPGSIQRTLLLARSARTRVGAFAVAIGCEMECDLGAPGLQYIHYPWLARFYPDNAGVDDASGWVKLMAVLRGRARPWQWMGDFSFQRMRSNRTLTNSNWTADIVRKAYAMSASVLYPPATEACNNVPWSARANSFVAVGRIHPEKRLDWMIEALEPLRAEMPDLQLHLAGTAGTLKVERDYLALLQRRIADRASWVTLHLNLTRADLVALMEKQRYGLHAMVDEHFGIAVAEMACAGCLPFVHRSGGAVEIVNGDDRLIYDSAEELRERFRLVASDERMQHDLQHDLASNAVRFSSQGFIDSFRRVVGDMVQRSPDDRLTYGS